MVTSAHDVRVVGQIDLPVVEFVECSGQQFRGAGKCCGGQLIAEGIKPEAGVGALLCDHPFAERTYLRILARRIADARTRAVQELESGVLIGILVECTQESVQLTRGDLHNRLAVAGEGIGHGSGDFL
jgi:hypothetical protein